MSEADYMHHPGTNEQVNFTPQKKYVKDAVTSKRSDDVQQHLLINDSTNCSIQAKIGLELRDCIINC